MCIQYLRISNIHPFTSDKLSSNFVLIVWLGTFPRPSVTFTIDCSTLLQEPVEEFQQQHLDLWLLIFMHNTI